MFVFKMGYFFLACILFLIELLIALLLNDRYIRPYAGDFLVVIFLYCLIRSFFKISVSQTLIVVLTFSIIIEVLQLFPILDFFEIKRSSLLAIALGTTFELIDILLYVAGCCAVLTIEWWRLKDKGVGEISSLSN